MATAFSVDGRTLAACSNNHVYLWDADSFESHAVLTGHDNQLNCLAVSRDGTMLASSGNDRQVVLWDLTAKEPTPTILGTHRVYVHCVAFSPDGQRLLSGSEDGMVQFWDVPSRRKLRSLRRHGGRRGRHFFAGWETHCFRKLGWLRQNLGQTLPMRSYSSKDTPDRPIALPLPQTERACLPAAKTGRSKSGMRPRVMSRGCCSATRGSFARLLSQGTAAVSYRPRLITRFACGTSTAARNRGSSASTPIGHGRGLRPR